MTNPLHIHDIQKRVCTMFGITLCQLTGRQRNAQYVAARHAAMAYCVNDGRWSLPQIGRAFNRDHTTVLYAARKAGL